MQFNRRGYLSITPGDEAVVDQVIHPGRSGRVLYRSSWWPARCEQNVTLVPQEVVYIVGRKNITLLVEPSPQRISIAHFSN